MDIKVITGEMAKPLVGIGQDDIKKKINTLRTPSFFFAYPVSRCSNASKSLRSIAEHSPYRVY